MTGGWLLLLAATVTAAPPATAPGRPDQIASAFWARDLGAARLQLEQLIIHDAGPAAKVGGPEQFWHELFDLADCVALVPGQERPHVPVNEWEVLIALTRLERLRQRRLLGTGPLPGLHEDLLKPEFFRRYQEESPGSNAIIWPQESELWGDEALTLKARTPTCARGFSPTDKQLAEWRAQELALVRSIQQGLAPGHPAWAGLRFEEAALLFQEGKLDEALEAARPLFTNPPPGLTASELAQATLLHAMDFERAGKREEALALYAQLSESQLTPQQQTFIRSRREWALAASGRYDSLLSVLPETPDLASPLGRYEAYLQARALLGLHRYDALLDEARKTLRRATADIVQSPEIGYLNDEVYEYLASVPFEQRVVELVEALGPPRFLYVRMERLAEIAAQDHRIDAARAVLSWLLEHQHNAEHHPRYRARMAELAFESGDLPGFAGLLREITAPSETLLKAIPPGRRGMFFADRDRQLLELVAHLVPRLAERNDDRWTEPVVVNLQQFLLTSPETQVIRPLTDFYRTARALLGKGAQSYAERIGDKKPPLVLGEVEVPHPQLELAPPSIPLEIDEPSSLLRIPVGDDPGVVRGWFAEGTP